MNSFAESWHPADQADLDWISASTLFGRTIRSGVPAVFQSYALLRDPDRDTDDPRSIVVTKFHETLLSLLLPTTGAEDGWYIGYLHTGHLPFSLPHVRPVTLYANWDYTLLFGNPSTAGWMVDDDGERYFPDLIFPANRSWLFTFLWDDYWSCLGGEQSLISRVLEHQDIEARQVGISDTVF